MIAQLKMLLRVKELKHDQALRAMQAKRQELDAARSAVLLAKARVEESASTYEAREDAIYAEVLGHVIDMDDVDATQGRVVQLEKDHTQLKDALERAIHVEARIEKELEEATAAYAAAVRKRDKFALLKSDAQHTLDAAAEYKEEAEVEDIFARPRAKAA